MGYEWEFLWEKGWRVEAVRAVSGSFALERRAQDDSVNKQRRKTNNGEEQATARTKANTEILAAPE